MPELSYDQLRYNQVQQKSSHNSYERKESIYDQILYWQIRSLEFDIRIDPNHKGEWIVKHFDYSIFSKHILPMPVLTC